MIAGVFFVLRRRRWQPLALLAAAVAGAVSLYNIVKPLTGRPRPPPAIWIGHYSGAAFPSGHAAQSVAFYAMLAIVLGAGRSPRAKTVLWSAAALVVLAVGGSRIYLGAHWLTDVLGGYALGACWVATRRYRHAGRPVTRSRPGEAGLLRDRVAAATGQDAPRAWHPAMSERRGLRRRAVPG